MSKEFAKNLLKNNKLLLFAREDHPKGYGYADGTAHGYVVIAVLCNEENIEKVVAKLGEYGEYNEETGRSKGWEGLKTDDKYYMGHLGDWYGGQFDLIAVFDGVGKLENSERFRSMGDNKFFGFYTSEEILEN